MNDAQKITQEILSETEGMKDVPVVQLPPRVSWGEGFKSWDVDKKLSYLIKFAEAMNDAAATMQIERDHFAGLCVKKEQQLEAMKANNDRDKDLLQSEITRMNAERQQYNKAIADLKKEVRELKNG